MTRLALTGFTNIAPLKTTPVSTGKVGIKLAQHIGAACEPVVKVGQVVRVGDPVGAVPQSNGKPALGAPVHASIAGRVTAIEDNTVRIERE
jgi:Na+-translocating ferredoxin:NAD+ oxidoreductase RnfC subunit